MGEGGEKKSYSRIVKAFFRAFFMYTGTSGMEGLPVAEKSAGRGGGGGNSFDRVGV